MQPFVWLCAVIVVVTGAATGCSSGSDVAVDAARAENTAASLSSAPIQQCADLLKSNWDAPEGMPNVSWDPETGEAVFEFGEEETLHINVFTDTTCARLPDGLGPMIQRMIDDDAAMKAQECADAVEQVNSGEPPRKGDIVGDLEALRKLVEEWCPPQFAKKLR